MFVKQVLKIVTFWVMRISKKKGFTSFKIQTLTFLKFHYHNWHGPTVFYFAMFSEKEISIQK